MTAYNRFRIAYEIQDACNPRAIARELVRVVDDASNDPNCKGTDWVCRDAAVVAVVDKLKSLMREDAMTALAVCRSCF